MGVVEPVSTGPLGTRVGQQAIALQMLAVVDEPAPSAERFRSPAKRAPRTGKPAAAAAFRDPPPASALAQVRLPRR